MLMIPPKVSFTKVTAETSIQRTSRQKLAHLLMLLPKLWDLHKVYGRNKYTKIMKTETSLPVNVAAKGELHKGRGTNKYTKIMKTETSIPVNVTAKGELHKCHEAAAYPLEHAPQLKHLTKQPIQWLGNGIMSAILLGTAVIEKRKQHLPD